MRGVGRLIACEHRRVDGKISHQDQYQDQCQNEDQYQSIYQYQDQDRDSHINITMILISYHRTDDFDLMVRTWRMMIIGRPWRNPGPAHPMGWFLLEPRHSIRDIC